MSTQIQEPDCSPQSPNGEDKKEVTERSGYLASSSDFFRDRNFGSIYETLRKDYGKKVVIPQKQTSGE